jgi:hypothetical protein
MQDERVLSQQAGMTLYAASRKKQTDAKEFAEP